MVLMMILCENCESGWYTKLVEMLNSQTYSHVGGFVFHFFCLASIALIALCRLFSHNHIAIVRHPHTPPQSVALTQDSLEMVHHGLFAGYNPLVVLSIVLQAVTGLVSSVDEFDCGVC